MNKKGVLMVLSGPSGSGKDTILSKLTEGNSNICISKSATTRKPRNSEVNGIHYYFVGEEEFECLIKKGDIIEFTKYGGNFYGTPKGPIDKWLNEGKTVILKIEVEGARKIKELYPESVSAFLMPPSMEILEKRLRNRATDTEESIQLRLETARAEIRQSKNYDYIIVNDVIENAVNDLVSIIRAENIKTKKMESFISEVINNV